MKLNDKVSVVLTKFGAAVVNVTNHRCNELVKDIISVEHLQKEDYIEDDVYEAQLWEIFQMFGKYCGIGETVVFKELKKENEE